MGAILVNTALWWAQLAIDLNNALAASIGNATPPNWNTLNGAHQALTDIVLGLVYVIVGLTLLLQILMRLAWIDLLLIVYPLAAECWVLPQTQGWPISGLMRAGAGGNIADMLAKALVLRFVLRGGGSGS